MATLIYSGILTVDTDHFWIGIVGGAVAALIAALRAPMVLAVLGAIVTDMGIYLILPLFA